MTTQPQPHLLRAIEDSFPIVEINRLAVPERNSFKPIYQMHKWFARRASCVFRAILLGCLKPLPLDENGRPLKSGAEVIMDEFYKDHTHDTDTNDKVILDPFMGGGTTVVEALRLGCKVIGVDLNPVAWFIVKTEVEPVDLDELRAAFDRLANRIVPWSGKPVQETLLEQYKTTCPCCGGEADSIYTFWVKSAICTNPTCKKQVPLFSDYRIAAKQPSIRYHKDAQCPRCKKTFDWEIEPATLIAEPKKMVNAGYSAGVGRGNVSWAYGEKEVVCPHCAAKVKPVAATAKPQRKKVPLTVLLCPACEAVWQWRGELPEGKTVDCPICRHSYDPFAGNVPDKGKFLCRACGNRDKIITSIRQLPEERLLPMRPYAIEGYCAFCAGNRDNEEEVKGKAQESLFESRSPQSAIRNPKSKESAEHICLQTKNHGKFFKALDATDLAHYQQACILWEKEKSHLLYPQQKIPDGQETHRLLEHHYLYWHQMFNLRQLLCLSTLLAALDEEEQQVLKEMLVSAFIMTTEANNLFTWQIKARRTPGGMAPGGVLRRHDFAPKSQICEQNVYGVVSGNNTFLNRRVMVEEAVQFSRRVWDNKWDASRNKNTKKINAEKFSKPELASLKSGDARNFSKLAPHFIVTDPPYAGNVNYSELADFFYVWLRIILAKTYSEFAPELTPKQEEIVQNPTREKSAKDFENGLQEVFKACYEQVSEDGLMTFTFHHSEGSAWESLLRAVCDAGFEVDCVYPIHSEREESLHLQNKEAISYDLIHVCKKRDSAATITPRSWAGIRQEIRKRAREEIRRIEAGRYGNESLSPADVNIILIGKCLELYSRHYGAVIDHEGKPFELHEALKEIRNLVDQLVSQDKPLPAELEDIDAESRVYLLTLCEKKEIKSDEVHKATRGGVVEPEDLRAAGLLIKGRAGRGRTYEVKQPSERYNALREIFWDGAMEGVGERKRGRRRTMVKGRKGTRAKGEDEAMEDLFGYQAPAAKTNHKTIFIDKIHFLMGLAENKENLMPWLDKWRGELPQLRAGCQSLKERNKNFAPILEKILNALDPGLGLHG